MSIRKQSALIFVASLVQLVFGIATGALTAHILQPTGKGIAILAFYVPNVMASLGSLSFGEASTYFLGRGMAAGRVIGTTVIEAVGLGILYAGLSLFLFLGPFKSVVHDVPVALVLLGLSTLPLMLLKNYGDSVLTGQHRVNAFIVGNLALHVLRGIFTFVALLVLKLGVAGAVGAEFLTWLLVGGWYAVAMTRGVRVEWRVDRDFARQQLKYGGQTHVGNIAQRLNLQVDTMILSAFAGAAPVGLYSVAVQIAQVLWYIPDSVGRLLFPRVASSPREEGNRVTPIACRNTILLTGLGAVVVILLGPTVIRWLFGKNFGPSVRPLFLLLPGIIGLSISKVLTKYLSGIGKPMYNAVASIVAFAVNAPLLYILIRRMGVDGAAIASSIAYCVHALVVTAFFVKESRTNPLESLLPTPKDYPLYRDSIVQAWRKIFGNRGDRP